VPPPPPEHIRSPLRFAAMPGFGRLLRLGLASRGGGALEPEDVEEALCRGVRCLNWCGQADGLSAAVRRLAARRRECFVAAQLEAREGKRARRELAEMLGELGTPYLDAVTYYWVEREEEWKEITAAGGAAEALEAARAAGLIRSIGLTSHQRPLAASVAASGRIDLLMVRYNAAHRGAEEEVFPAAERHALPLVAYTALRWGALLRPTPDDPPGFTPPRAPDCYRFALCHPAVSAVLMAPHDRGELEEDLGLIDDWRGFEPEDYVRLREHGDRVHRHAGGFP
jgi:predicted aldo/keto reductase-like oxidoreductase